MTIKQILENAARKLKENQIEEPTFHARMLLANRLKKQKEYLMIYEGEEVSKEIKEKYQKDVLELIQGKPVQYITNHQEFMKMDFYVDENVLIPRADTEILVEEVIKISKQIKKEDQTILDLCTGSGAIAISLANYIPNAKVYASDISEEALKIAKKNSEKNKVRIEWVLSDLFQNIHQKFDIIVSNPPYIQTKVIKTLEKNVQKEPILALDGGKDGLEFYKKIIQEADSYLKENGYLCFEIGYDQRESVIHLLKQKQKYKEIYGKKDLSGNDRIIVAKR